MERKMRTLVDIPEHQIKSLSILCEKFDISRAEAIRKAIELFIQGNKQSTEDVFGIWKNKNIEGITYQQKLRDEW
jgi:metal-responsive CopG/Arc/MetJ family transcriptional regulator